jgi:hypothetical protein
VKTILHSDPAAEDDDQDEPREENQIPDDAKTTSDDPDLQQRLQDCRRFLNHFGEFATASLEDCQSFIDHQLNVNLYDLLNWLRNPDTAAQPDRFPSVKDLSKYSYESNKVFPRFRATKSDISSPLLRNIGPYGHDLRRGRRVYKSKSGGKKRAYKRRAEQPAPTKESEWIAVSMDFSSSSTTDGGITHDDDGASLFNLPESTPLAPSGKTSRFARKRRGAISGSHPPKDMAAGETVAVAA